MNKNIVFVNNYAHGDIYIPIRFIEDLASLVTNKIYYAIKTGFESVKLKKVELIHTSKIPLVNAFNYEDEDNYYFDIWLMRINDVLGVDCGINILYYYIFFDTHFYKPFNLQIKSFEYYIPITISEYQNEIKENINTEKKNILICNGECMSQQIENFKFDLLVEKIVNLNQNIKIYLTHKDQISEKYYNNDNIEFIDEKYKIPNLCEISEFGKNCDIIIGRNSGLFYWCQNQETLNKKFICYTRDIHKIYDNFNVTPIYCGMSGNDIENIFNMTINLIN